MASTVHSTGRASPFVLTYVGGILPQSENLELIICAIHLHSSLAAMSGVFSRGTDKIISVRYAALIGGLGYAEARITDNGSIGCRGVAAERVAQSTARAGLRACAQTRSVRPNRGGIRHHHLGRKDAHTALHSPRHVRYGCF